MIKKVVNAYYAHKSNLKELMEKTSCFELAEFVEAAEDAGYDFTIVKYDRGAVTLLKSADWDTANEPLVDVAYRWAPDAWYNEDGTLATPKTMKNGRQIYHNKWQFVADDYTGFDIEKAKQRTKDWNAIPGIEKIKNKIGNKNFWVELLKENGLEL